MVAGAFACAGYAGSCRPFEVTLENPHVVSPSQICVAAITTGPQGTPLNSSFRARDDIRYKMDLGNALGTPRAAALRNPLLRGACFGAALGLH